MSPEVQIWLDKAEEDWLAAGWLLQEDSPVVLPAIFHIQQAAEKLLKGYLSNLGIDFERKHDMTYLLSLAPESTFESYLGFLEELSPFAVEIRYPGDFGPMNRGDGLSLLEQLQLFREEIYLVLNAPLPKPFK